MNALYVCFSGPPEVKFSFWSRGLSLLKQFSRICSQDFINDVRPADDHGLYCIYPSSILTALSWEKEKKWIVGIVKKHNAPYSYCVYDVLKSHYKTINWKSLKNKMSLHLQEKIKAVIQCESFHFTAFNPVIDGWDWKTGFPRQLSFHNGYLALQILIVFHHILWYCFWPHLVILLVGQNRQTDLDAKYKRP